jgi:lipopolysaccharide biosynthesis regulator YciM
VTGGGFLLLLGILAVGAAIAWPILRGRRSSAKDRRPPYLVALGALIDGDKETAFTELKNAVRRDSSNVDAYLRLGDLFRERGDAERALHLHRELTARAGLDDLERARIHEALARDWLALDRLDRAAEAAQESVKRSPDPIHALELLLQIHERRDDYDEAFRTKRELLKRQGRVKTAAAELADYRAQQTRDLLDQGELSAAERLLKEARRIDESAARTAYLWGLLQEKKGDYPAALHAWEDILTRHPEQVVRLFRSLERVHFLNGTYGDMESTYHRFLEAVPGHEDASFGLARFLLRKGQLEAALKVCRTSLDHHPYSEPLRVLRLLLLLQIGRAGEAERLLNEWIGEILGEKSAPSSAATRSPLYDPSLESPA